MAMALQYVNVRKNDLRVLHFAPEQSLQSVLLRKYGTRYMAADYAPEIYQEWSQVPVQKIDLRRPNFFLPKGSVEGLIHCHVLEHIPGSIERIIHEMNAAIVPGGFHLFVVPIDSGWYREDMDPDLSEKERTERFNQFDHVRLFGTEDFEERCLRLFDKEFKRVNLRDRIPEDELKKAAAPQTALKNYTGNTPFLFIKE